MEVQRRKRRHRGCRFGSGSQRRHGYSDCRPAGGRRQRIDNHRGARSDRGRARGPTESNRDRRRAASRRRSPRSKRRRAGTGDVLELERYLGRHRGSGRDRAGRLRGRGRDQCERRRRLGGHVAHGRAQVGAHHRAIDPGRVAARKAEPRSRGRRARLGRAAASGTRHRVGGLGRRGRHDRRLGGPDRNRARGPDRDRHLWR